MRYVGQTFTADYRLTATGGDGVTGCNVDAANAATVTVNLPSGLTASSSTLTYTACGADHEQTVTFTPTTAGSKTITASISGGKPGATYNTNPATFTVTINADTTPPVLTLPGDMLLEATGSAGAVATYSASANDAVDGPRSVSCSPVSGSTFAIAATTVACSASDTHGNTANGSFKVTVRDTTPPTVTAPGNVTAEATGPSGAVVTFGSGSANDLVDGSLSAPCAGSGSTFLLGNSSVTCTATDSHGNSASASFTITVRDTTPPTVTVPANITAEATGSAGAAVSYSGASASDLVDGSLAASCTPASGGTFGLGPTTITCSATDSHGNGASATFTITVADTTPPTVNVPANITTEATGPSGAVVTYSGASGNDLVDGSVSASCAAASGSTFALGTNSVTCTSTDSHGNSGTGTFTITVRDTTPPTVTVPANMTAEATSGAGAAVTYSGASASDLVDGAVTPVCLAASGTTFPLGTTTVTCTATDAHGNSASANFTITVVDTTPPAVSVPANMTAEATGPSGASVTFSSSATDLVDGAVTPSCLAASGATFPLGTTTVTCTATDAHHNSANASFTITVVDTTPPTVTVPANITAEATGPNGASVTYSSASASDLVDGTVAVSCSPASGSTFALGTNTVTCTATDAHHNVGSNSFTVTVVDTTAPTMNSVTAGSGAVAINGSVALSASGNDIVSLTNLTYSYWVDGSPLTGSSYTAGSAADVVQVCARATDGAGNRSDQLCTWLAIYDPSSGFVTGGGWIASPAGALQANPSLTGKATFGFVSKYLKGAQTPVGNTEFQFQVANFRFSSTNYQWLVVSGQQAQYKGTGTINGAGSYTFILTAYDNGSSGDGFRIKITDGSNVIYDNVPGGSDDMSRGNTQAIGGGSIVIHK